MIFPYEFDNQTYIESYYMRKVSGNISNPPTVCPKQVKRIKGFFKDMLKF